MIVDRDGMQDFHFEESVVAILIDVPPYLERNLPNEGSYSSGDDSNGSSGNEKLSQPADAETGSDVEMQL